MDKKEDLFDEHGHNISQENKVLSANYNERKAAYEKWINKTAKNLSSKYHIPNEAISDLKKLVRDLCALPHEHKPDIILQADKMEIPEDQPLWSNTKKKLENVRNNLGKALDGLDEIIIDENFVGITRLQDVDYEDNIADLINLTRDLYERIDDATNYKGRPGRKIRPSWSYIATDLTREFWAQYKNEHNRGHFTEDNAEMPNTEFTKWYCDIMKLTTDTSRTKCQTFLRD